MRCPKCKEDGAKHTLTSLGSSATLMSSAEPYYDEDDVYHRHDPNWRKSAYRCSKGHWFMIKKRSSCPGCDYGRGSEELVSKN